MLAYVGDTEICKTLFSSETDKQEYNIMRVLGQKVWDREEGSTKKEGLSRKALFRKLKER